MLKFIVGEPGEPYCKIPIKCLKLLNKFLGTTINNSKTEFCKLDGPDKFLFLVDKEYYRTDVRLTSTATRGPWACSMESPRPTTFSPTSVYWGPVYKSE